MKGRYRTTYYLLTKIYTRTRTLSVIISINMTTPTLSNTGVLPKNYRRDYKGNVIMYNII